MPRDVGLTDVLLGNVKLEDAVQGTGVANLFVLLSGGAPPNPAEVIEGRDFRALLDECSARFDRVILDSPPVLPVTDPAILAAMCDGVIMVVRSGRTLVAQAQRARRILGDTGARMLGVILNDVRQRGYGYGYGYGGYGYGYGNDRAEDTRRRAGAPVAGG